MHDNNLPSEAPPQGRITIHRSENTLNNGDGGGGGEGKKDPRRFTYKIVDSKYVDIGTVVVSIEWGPGGDNGDANVSSTAGGSSSNIDSHSASLDNLKSTTEEVKEAMRSNKTWMANIDANINDNSNQLSRDGSIYNSSSNHYSNGDSDIFSYMLGGGREFDDEYRSARNGKLPSSTYSANSTNRYMVNEKGDVEYDLGPEATIIQLHSSKKAKGEGGEGGEKKGAKKEVILNRPPPVAFSVLMNGGGDGGGDKDKKKKKKSGFFGGGGAGTARSKEQKFLKRREEEWKKAREDREKKIVAAKALKKKDRIKFSGKGLVQGGRMMKESQLEPDRARIPMETRMKKAMAKKRAEAKNNMSTMVRGEVTDQIKKKKETTVASKKVTMTTTTKGSLVNKAKTALLPQDLLPPPPFRKTKLGVNSSAIGIYSSEQLRNEQRAAFQQKVTEDKEREEESLARLRVMVERQKKIEAERITRYKLIEDKKERERKKAIEIERERRGKEKEKEEEVKKRVEEEKEKKIRRARESLERVRDFKKKSQQVHLQQDGKKDKIPRQKTVMPPDPPGVVTKQVSPTNQAAEKKEAEQVEHPKTHSPVMRVEIDGVVKGSSEGENTTFTPPPAKNEPKKVRAKPNGKEDFDAEQEKKAKMEKLVGIYGGGGTSPKRSPKRSPKKSQKEKESRKESAKVTTTKTKTKAKTKAKTTAT